MSGHISSHANNADFNDPRLVEVYDAESPWGRDDDYFFEKSGISPNNRGRR